MTLTETVAKIGLEVVLQGINDFRRGLEESNRLIDKFAKGGREVEKSFSPANRVLSAFVESLRRITEFVVAGLIIRGFEKITSAIRGMVDAMIAAGAEFQILTVRLEQLLAREILDTGMVKSFAEALNLAVPAAEDLFVWIQKLALTTPFDIQDVAETITFAKAYGFVADEAKRVTAAIVDFASGMGLTSVQMKRIIENFGQMIQQGKVTNTELRDLGRGALVPINAILERMRENMGLTTEEFQKFRMEGKLEVMPFIEAFIQIVGEDFPNAGRRASRTITAVLGNIKDLIDGMLGFNIVRPILDVVSEKLAQILDALTTGERGEALIAISQQIGEGLAGIVESLFGVLPSGEGIADIFIGTLDKIKGAIFGLREIIEEIISGQIGLPEGVSAALIMLGLPPDFAEGVAEVLQKLSTLKETVLEIVAGFREGGLVGGLEVAGAPPAIIGFVEDIQTALENIRLFWQQNREQIIGIIDQLIGTLLRTGETGGTTLLEILGDQLVRFSEKLVTDGPTILDFIERMAIAFDEKLVPAIESIANFLLENQDNVINFFIAMQIVKALAPYVIALAGALVFLNTPLLTFITLLAGAVFIITTFKDTVGILVGLMQQMGQILGLIASILWTGFTETIGRTVAAIREWGGRIAWEMWNIAYNAVLAFSDSFGRMWNWFKSNLWIMAQNAIITLQNSWNNKWGDFINNIIEKFIEFRNWIRFILGIHSRSKVFYEIGRFMMQGLAKGIADGFRFPEEAMKLAVAATIAPAINAVAPAMTGNTTNTTNNFSLTVNSSAQREPLVADFRLMESLASTR